MSHKHDQKIKLFKWIFNPLFVGITGNSNSEEGSDDLKREDKIKSPKFPKILQCSNYQIKLLHMGDNI